VVLRDTKNRSDHKLLLSRQALEIAKRNCAGRNADAPLFPVVDARKTLAWINGEAGTNVQGHGLRATFASIAEEVVSSALLKRMMNHAAAGDVTLGHLEVVVAFHGRLAQARSSTTAMPWPTPMHIVASA